MGAKQFDELFIVEVVVVVAGVVVVVVVGVVEVNVPLDVPSPLHGHRLVEQLDLRVGERKPLGVVLGRLQDVGIGVGRLEPEKIQPCKIKSLVFRVTTHLASLHCSINEYDTIKLLPIYLNFRMARLCHPRQQPFQTCSWRHH